MESSRLSEVSRESELSRMSDLSRLSEALDSESVRSESRRTVEDVLRSMESSTEVRREEAVRRVADVLGIQGFATGGVFEPNSPVLGILGDNTREKEIAAPYSTIVKAVKEAMAGVSLEGSQRIELTANVVLDGRTVAKTTFPYLVQESKRLGTSL